MNIENFFDISNKLIIITGAAGMLGKNYAMEFSRKGANVVLADIDFSKCKEIEKTIIQKFHTRPMSINLDLSKKNSILSMTKKVLNKYGKIDVLINNAAYQGDPKIRKAGFENLSLDVWNKAIEVNLTGIFLCCQIVGKQMLKQKFGNIINIGSTYGIVAPDQKIYGTSGQNSAAFYAATKSGLIHLTKYLAAYWEGKGIRVNSFSPGGVENNQSGEFIKKYSFRTPMNRMAKKDEYVDSLIFLASDASSYMTGSNLVVDGGWTAW